MTNRKFIQDFKSINLIYSEINLKNPNLDPESIINLDYEPYVQNQSKPTLDSFLIRSNQKIKAVNEPPSPKSIPEQILNPNKDINTNQNSIKSNLNLTILNKIQSRNKPKLSKKDLILKFISKDVNEYILKSLPKITNITGDKLKYYSTSFAIMVVALIISIASSNLQNINQASASEQVLGVEELIIIEPDTNIEFKLWLEEHKIENQDKNLDSDDDQLTNYEEFQIGSDPKSAYSCDNERTDSQNLYNLINPVTCQEINIENVEEYNKFNQVIELSQLHIRFENKSFINEDSTEIQADNLKDVFNTASFHN